MVERVGNLGKKKKMELMWEKIEEKMKGALYVMLVGGELGNSEVESSTGGG